MAQRRVEVLGTTILLVFPEEFVVVLEENNQRYQLNVDGVEVCTFFLFRNEDLLITYAADKLVKIVRDGIILSRTSEPITVPNSSVIELTRTTVGIYTEGIVHTWLILGQVSIERLNSFSRVNPHHELARALEDWIKSKGTSRLTPVAAEFYRLLEENYPT